MSDDERKLAATVYHKGIKYSAGMTAAEIGDAAADIGDHAWEGGEAAPAAGTRLGTPPVPTKSALPTPAGAPAADDSKATGDATPTGKPSSHRRGGASGAG
jgi:hypothetical protein